MTEEEILKKFHKKFSRKGGLTTKNKYGDQASSYYAMLAKRSAEVRREKRDRKLSTKKDLT